MNRIIGRKFMKSINHLYINKKKVTNHDKLKSCVKELMNFVNLKHLGECNGVSHFLFKKRERISLVHRIKKLLGFFVD